MHNLANLKNAQNRDAPVRKDLPHLPRPTLHFPDGETETGKMKGLSKNTQEVGSGQRETILFLLALLLLYSSEK